jgi:hypothetical protein
MRLQWIQYWLCVLAFAAVSCDPGPPRGDDDDSAGDDDTVGDDDTAGDDDISGDDDDTAGDDDDTAGDDDDDSAEPPEVLGDGSSALTGVWNLVYWIDQDAGEQACEQTYEWLGTATFSPNALGNSCLDCGGSIDVLNVTDLTPTTAGGCSVEFDLGGVDLGDILTNADPTNPYRDFIYPQGLITTAYGLAEEIDLTLDATANFSTFSDNPPAGVFLSHIGYLEEVEGRYFSGVNSGAGLGSIAATPPNSPTWMPFWRYYGQVGNATDGSFDGHYFFGSIWVINFNFGESSCDDGIDNEVDPNTGLVVGDGNIDCDDSECTQASNCGGPGRIATVSFGGELDAIFTPAGPS